MLALVVGTLLAVGALAFVLHPLFFSVGTSAVRRRAVPAGSDDSAIVALREIEFDRATGKLSESDYAELRAKYGARALSEMRASTGSDGAAASVDPIEARVRAYRMTHRECANCGLRPEPDAAYCSTCGAYLERACPHCAAPIPERGAAFCSTCGASLTSSPAPR